MRCHCDHRTCWSCYRVGLPLDPEPEVIDCEWCGEEHLPTDPAVYPLLGCPPPT